MASVTVAWRVLRAPNPRPPHLQSTPRSVRQSVSRSVRQLLTAAAATCVAFPSHHRRIKHGCWSRTNVFVNITLMLCANAPNRESAWSWDMFRTGARYMCFVRFSNVALPLLNRLRLLEDTKYVITLRGSRALNTTLKYDDSNGKERSDTDVCVIKGGTGLYIQDAQSLEEL